MSRRTAVLLVVGLLAFLAFAAWFDVSGRDGKAQPAPNPQPTSTAAPKQTFPPSDDPVVNRNRDERKAADWSPESVVGPDGKPLLFGRVVPGAFEPVPAGTEVKVAIDAGFMERDRQREQACEGTFWKWKGQLSQGLDVIVGANQQILSLGMSRAGLETPEGISIGNSFGALVQTYGDRLQGPVRMDYGQAGAFLQDGDAWVGFGMDNEPGQLADDSRIAFIEVSRGARPGLLRDGC